MMWKGLGARTRTARVFKEDRERGDSTSGVGAVPDPRGLLGDSEWGVSGILSDEGSSGVYVRRVSDLLVRSRGPTYGTVLKQSLDHLILGEGGWGLRSRLGHS